MTEPQQPGWWTRWANLITILVTAAAAALVGAVGNQQCRKPRVERQVVEVERPAGDGYAPVGGWLRDDDEIARNLDPVETLQFAATPAGRAVMQNADDVFLWRAVRKSAGLPPDRYPNVNQGSVGCCVGAGYKHGVDCLQAVQIGGGVKAEWKPVSVEVIYGGSRVEVGGGRISGDGSVGAWAARFVKDYGVVPMEKFGELDLTTFSPARAREFGRKGVPDDLEPVARKHPVKGAALVKTWPEVDRAVRQGYPVVVCSDQGFRMERDAGGWARPQGTWMHCMVVLGVRGGDREGGFVLNSWGDQAHTGPRWPDDMPPAGFWADSRTIDRMVRQADSFALSDVQGFPARDVPLNWFIRAGRRRGGDTFARLVPEVDSWLLAP